jgi:hypothetical protein
MDKVLTDYKPTIYIDSKQLPAVKDWKVGETYVVVLKIKMTGMHEREDKSVSGDFQIEKVTPKDEKKDLSGISKNSDFSKAAAGVKKNMVY